VTTQYARALVRIREMILRGALAPGQRLSEASLADMLGMTRTPVRQALPALALEGLVSEHDTRGYVVRGFTSTEICDAIDVRGALEGLAARQIAQRGTPKALLRDLRHCLEDGDRIFGKKRLVEADSAPYSEMNVRFHALIVEGAASQVISEALARNNHIPFAGPQALAFAHSDLAVTFEWLYYAHRQHHAIVEALQDGDAARVEALMREHASAVKISANVARQRSPRAERAESTRKTGVTV
jgi:GntR family transcriptional regulator, vanillate catabolism transcriptional regulator